MPTKSDKSGHLYLPIVAGRSMFFSVASKRECPGVIAYLPGYRPF